MAKRWKKEKFSGGSYPATELLLLAVLVIDKLTELYRQTGQT